MSDIGINITPWAIALGLLATIFWPLTAAAAAAVLWLLRRRASIAARIVAAGALVLWSASALTNILVFLEQARNARDYQASLRARQTTLHAAAIIDGMHLPAGTIVTRGDPGSFAGIVAIDVPRAVTIRGIPVVEHAGVDEGKLDGEVMLARDVRIGEAWCSSKEPARFDSGALTACILARPSRIHGIPCTGEIDLQNGVVCTLAAEYRRYGIVWRETTKVTDFGDLVWFRVGSVAPSLFVFSLPLNPDSEVQFQKARMASVDLRSKPVSYRGCSFDLILAHGRSLLGQTTGVCALPTVPPGYVLLPAEAVALR
ncbi:MAG TPA: hypothetical protein VGG70_06150 [Candidatus Cybelea sp.]|jgi:hypothetical protein